MNKSEGNAMKKDIEWLKEAVGELNLVDTVFEADGVSYIDTAVSVMQVYDLTDELDEQEVLSREWLDENKSSWTELKVDGYYIPVEKLQNLLVPKQELPVIPDYVADWITRYREKYDLYPALRLLENNTFVWGEIYEWYRMNTRKFVNAYLTGEYEVEEEPRYYVDLDTAAYVAKWIVNNEVGIYTDTISGNDEFEFYLTEQEIKDFDERFWAFAEAVEEDK